MKIISGFERILIAIDVSFAVNIKYTSPFSNSTLRIHDKAILYMCLLFNTFIKHNVIPVAESLSCTLTMLSW